MYLNAAIVHVLRVYGSDLKSLVDDLKFVVEDETPTVSDRKALPVENDLLNVKSQNVAVVVDRGSVHIAAHNTDWCAEVAVRREYPVGRELAGVVGQDPWVLYLSKH